MCVACSSPAYVVLNARVLFRPLFLSLAHASRASCVQACPYVICLFFIPCHYYTHMVMFGFTAVWATNIHDAVPGNTEPIMGAKYHTVSPGGGHEKAPCF